MSTLEIKKELLGIIEKADEDFLKRFHEAAKAYISRTDTDKMIAESEQDIRAGKIHSQTEVDKIIDSWKE